MLRIGNDLLRLLDDFRKKYLPALCYAALGAVACAIGDRPLAAARHVRSGLVHFDIIATVDSPLKIQIRIAT
jgi:hypothetical protein